MRARSPPAQTVNALPDRPRSSTSQARTSLCSWKPKRTAPGRRTSMSSSPLTMTAPPGRMCSSISALPRKMFSRVPKNSMCATPTLVIRQMVGCAMADRRRISPGWLVPISMMASSCSGSSRNSVSGTPVWLFRLPGVLNVRKREESTAASISFVEVLPTLPVTPMTGMSNRQR